MFPPQSSSVSSPPKGPFMFSCQVLFHWFSHGSCTVLMSSPKYTYRPTLVNKAVATKAWSEKRQQPSPFSGQQLQKHLQKWVLRAVWPQPKAEVIIRISTGHVSLSINSCSILLTSQVLLLCDSVKSFCLSEIPMLVYIIQSLLTDDGHDSQKAGRRQLRVSTVNYFLNREQLKM